MNAKSVCTPSAAPKAKRDIAKAKAETLGWAKKLAALLVAGATMLATEVPLPSPAWADGWHQIAELVEPGSNTSDAFGVSVAVSGRSLVVGADGSDNGAGRAFVFTETTSGWQQVAELAGTASTAEDHFGSSVAVSGNTAVVSAPGNGSQPGLAYVFSRTASGWHQVAALAGIGTAGFGSSVAISGRMLVVGADGDGYGLGAAYVFSEAASGWHQTARLVGRRANDLFGCSVGISGETMVVGAEGFYYDAGRAYVFVKAEPGWHQTAELAEPKPSEGDAFGASVSISSGTVAVSAHVLNTYLFTASATRWH
jgi:hypothetical protein